ncbi:MAG: DUF4124 domain-containing protein [Desulfosalsimonadaceae bacterium]|nr:DUF4124 domain-containing protein [Desulfosalsimonadaceae bacterium]
MKWHPFILAVAAVFLLSTGASGEYYQYTDKDGTVRFTDDPSMIPEDQGPEVTKFESIKTEPQPDMTGEESVQTDEEGEGTEAAEEAEKVGEAEETETDVTKSSMAVNREKEDELNDLRGELRIAFDALEAEKKALGPPPPRNARTVVRKEYNNKVMELNRKIDDYDKRKKEFDEKGKAYNSQIDGK